MRFLVQKASEERALIGDEVEFAFDLGCSLYGPSNDCRVTDLEEVDELIIRRIVLKDGTTRVVGRVLGKVWVTVDDLAELAQNTSGIGVFGSEK
jgi:hypothetical protein